jgi:hypothetical protein
MLVAGKPELREYKAVFVVNDVEASQFSDEITVNCAPLVEACLESSSQGVWVKTSPRTFGTKPRPTFKIWWNFCKTNGILKCNLGRQVLPGR